MNRLFVVANSLTLAGGGLLAQQPPRSNAEPVGFVEAARQVALNYASGLPNFLCTQTVRRFFSPGTYFSQVDTLTVEVGYYEGQEKYRLVRINGVPVDTNYGDARGTISRGEFGANLRTIFDPDSAAEFHFERWTTVSGRRAAVYSYRVERSKADYEITAQAYDQRPLREHVGLRGEAVIDRETHGILRLTYMADAIPPGFPVRRTSVIVEYGEVKIGAQRYLLPLKATVELENRSRTSRNEVTFHSYRKFSADSSIRFGAEPRPQP